MTPFFEARDAAKWFRSGDVRALEGASIAVPRGGFLVLTGPSGSGKTTLLALLATLERPTSGAVLVDGVDPARASESARSSIRRRLGLAFTGGPMFRGLALWEDVTLGLVPLGAAVAERRRLAGDLLARVGLADKLRARAEELSTGETQRAALARALASRPEALVLDEPLANLDPATSAVVLSVLADAHRAGTTIVVASHDTGVVGLATQTARLAGGRIVGRSDGIATHDGTA